MPNPTGKGLKPNKPGERRGGRQAGTRDLRTLVREAAEETGLIERVPVLDKEGKPTGRYEFRYGAEGEKGYLKWVARNHPGHFMALYGKLLPLEVNQKVEEKPIVHYETLEERRAAMIAKGWAPSAVADLEEAMQPKFLRDMREEEERENMKVVEEVVEEGGETEGEH
jgi:8-oxo-dGTP pyrophosphatase MutT (NUDIX family)